MSNKFLDMLTPQEEATLRSNWKANQKANTNHVPVVRFYSIGHGDFIISELDNDNIVYCVAVMKGGHQSLYPDFDYIDTNDLSHAPMLKKIDDFDNEGLTLSQWKKKLDVEGSPALMTMKEAEGISWAAMQKCADQGMMIQLF